MYISETRVRVRYAETDQMGYVYYGNYAQYYELGRVEALRQLGISYKEMEDSGIMLPVYSLHVDYKKAAIYDDELLIVTAIKEVPAVRIAFDYEIYNQKKELLNTGHTKLAFVNKQTGKPCMAPAALLQNISTYFTE
jgi:acyl-CoA thioester hydrolase